METETRRIRATVSQFECVSAQKLYCLRSLIIHRTLCHSPLLKKEHSEQIYQRIAHFLISSSSSNRSLQRNNCNGAIKNNLHRLRPRAAGRRVVDVIAIQITTMGDIVQEKTLYLRLIMRKRLRRWSERAHLQSNGASLKLRGAAAIPCKVAQLNRRRGG